MNIKSISGLFVSMILLVLVVAAFSLPAAAANAQVSIADDASAAQGAKTTTPIEITQLTQQLGAATIVLEYDADVEVVSVTPGTMGAFAAAPGIDNANHKTTITWFSATGVTGAQTFAQVELKALGSAGATSPLDLTITTFDSTGGAAIGVDDDDGLFTVAGGPQNAQVSIADDASAAQGAKTTTPIEITQLTQQLGAATIVLEYDADVEVVSVTPGTMGAFAAAPGIDNANHKTTITWFSATGVTGAQTFAQVELKALGSAGATSPLDLTITTFDSTGGAAIGVDDDDGLFTVAGGPQNAQVSIADDVSAAQGGCITTTPIEITQLTEQLGAATIVLEYDADVEVVSVTPGTMGAFAAAPGIDNANHRTTITWFKATGVTGDQTFAQVELKALGSAGATSPLDLTIITFDSTGGAAIGVDDDDGLFTVAPPTTFYADADGDGYGDPAVTQEACSAPTGYVSDNTDCNDGNPNIHPGAAEICNGIDDDCDGQIDEGVKNTYYLDADGDGYGNASVSTEACSAPAGYVSDHTDCDDANAAVNPGATEVYNGIDDDCDGQIDEDCCPCDFCLDLKEGWNFVSVPKRINGTNDAATIFNLDPANETCEYYNASAGSWMNPADIDVVPCQGYWVWKVSAETICIDFLSTGAITPPMQQLYEGWNMIGHIDTSVMPIDAGTIADFGSMANIEGKFSQIWQWKDDTWDLCYPPGLNYMTPGQGYWIWMTEDSPMSGTP